MIKFCVAPDTSQLFIHSGHAVSLEVGVTLSEVPVLLKSFSTQGEALPQAAVPERRECRVELDAVQTSNQNGP